MTGIDGRVNNLNRDVFTAARQLQTVSGDRTKSAQAARNLQSAILKDNKIDDAERDLLNEITRGNGGEINISGQKSASFNPQDLKFKNNFSSDAVNILKNTNVAQGSNAELESIWRNSANPIRELTRIYSGSPAGKEQVTNFLASKANDAWDRSSIGNGYGPMRDMISSAYGQVNQLSGSENEQGRWMLFDAIKKVDTNPNGSDGAIPNMLYNWIRPGGYL